MRRRLRSLHGEERERGAVLIEFSLVAMLLLTLGMGVFEFSYGWRSSMSVLTSARGAARTASSLGTDTQTDYYALSSIKANLDSAGLLNGLQTVIIYRADTAGGEVPAGCVSGSPKSTDLCNVYTGAQVRSVAPTQFSSTTGCMTGAAIAKYCPSSRVKTQAVADYLGVWVQARQGALTKFFGVAGFTVDRQAVMRLEPS